MLRASRSPEFMKRSFCGSGVKVVRVESRGFAGACALPFLVTNANWKVSMPTLAAHVLFCRVPATGSSSTLNTFNAAHHWVGLQVEAPIATCQVGHGTQPGG